VRIVIAMDGGPSSAACVQSAVARPWPSNSRFCLFTALNPYPFTAAPIIQERLVARVLGNLENACKSLRDAGWDTSIEVRNGSPHREINKFASDWEADLIMVGCNDFSDVERLFLGSTARTVVRHAPCSVEVVRPQIYRSGVENGLRILAATDGSELSRVALGSIEDRPWPSGSMVKVISVPEFILVKDRSYFQTHEFIDLGQAAVEDAKESIAAAMKIFSQRALKVSSAVPTLEDRPYKVILHEAEVWPADLIVVGSHGRTGFDRFIMGSVSEAVALHAVCSVEIIRQLSQQR
jgi:nucleotide-binding universal stress UspA family protein